MATVSLCWIPTVTATTGPVHPARGTAVARRPGRAAVFKRYPFTIILQDSGALRVCPCTTHRLKIDPGSKTTGLALLDGDKCPLGC